MTTKKLQTILEMVDRGCLQKDIAKAVNVSVSTVSIWARKYGRVRIPRRYCLKMYTIYGKDGNTPLRAPPESVRNIWASNTSPSGGWRPNTSVTARASTQSIRRRWKHESRPLERKRA